jgi:hypothetical protein
MPKIRKHSQHAFYVHPLQFDENIAGVHRDLFIDAVKKELPNTLLREESDVLLSYGYVKPLYMLPIYQERVAFGEYPFNLSNIDYKSLKCPTVEDIYFNKLITHEFMRPGMLKSDMDDVIKAFVKVWEYRDEL